MKRRIAFILMSVLMAVALTACGQASLPESAQGAADTITAVASSAAAAEAPAASKTLVAYFSRAGENYGVGMVEMGNTEIIAKMIAEKLGADTFRIQTVNAYPESYDACTKVAKQERDSKARPELTSTIASIDDYDVIYLGYPIWYGDMPMAVYTFLESYDFAGKTILPFCTHAGSGFAGTVGSIQAACRGAAVLDGLAIAGTTAQNDPASASKAVNAWIDQ